jgi:Putative transposase
MTVSADKFLRRFLLHVLPRGFVRIHHFGFLTNRSRARLVATCRRLLSDAPLAREPSRVAQGGDGRHREVDASRHPFLRYSLGWRPGHLIDVFDRRDRARFGANRIGVAGRHFDSVKLLRLLSWPT